MLSAAKSDRTPGSADIPVDAERPRILKLRSTDLFDALRRGLADFNAAPTHVVFLSLIYPVVGLLLARASFSYDLLPLLFPLVAGFALLGPFAALGLYEISRVREQGQPVTWRNALGVVSGRSIVAILILGAALSAIFATWLFTASALYDGFFSEDDRPRSLVALLEQIVTTPAGWKMMLIGNAVGAAFAVVAFTISVVSFPLLVDRNTDALTAVITSVRAVAANPLVMAQWGLIVVALLVVGSIPAFMGLAVVMPLLGHATWHLYRKVVA